MPLGSLESIAETAYGFRTKIKYFIERIEKLRHVLAREKSEISILDVGCGNAMQVTFPLGAQGYEVTGLDMHHPSLAFARKENIFSRVQFVEGDTTELASKVGEKKFDIVILSDILEHVLDPRKLLCDVARLLQPHGIVLISIPNGFGPFEIENFLLRKTGLLAIGKRLLKKQSIVPYNHENGHIQFFSRKKIEELLGLAGFVMHDFHNGCFLGGSGSNYVISRSALLIRLNLALARFLPDFLCSLWYFEARKNHVA